MILSRAVAAFSKLRVKLVARGVALRCVALRWGPDLALALHKVASQVYPLFHAFKVRFMKATSSVDFQKERLQSGRLRLWKSHWLGGWTVFRGAVCTES